MPPFLPLGPNDTWTMIGALAALVALAAAVWYAVTTAQMFRRDHRPMVRVVWSTAPNVVLLKNMGRGPAFGAVLTDAKKRNVSTKSVDVVEPLGPPRVDPEGPSESTRPGRRAHHLNTSIEADSDYYLYYQDIVGRWHKTTARLSGNRFANRFSFLGTSGYFWGRWRVPPEVRAQSLIR